MLIAKYTQIDPQKIPLDKLKISLQLPKKLFKKASQNKLKPP